VAYVSRTDSVKLRYAPANILSKSLSFLKNIFKHVFLTGDLHKYSKYRGSVCIWQMSKFLQMVPKIDSEGFLDMQREIQRFTAYRT
jgi:hypothetical protein